ncbi:MAG: hypothetical protein ACXWW4_18270 [Candidatus Binatia bacterium]
MHADEVANTKEIQLAALALLAAARADWHQWDSSAPATNCNQPAITFYFNATFVISSASRLRVYCPTQPDSRVWLKIK